MPTVVDGGRVFSATTKPYMQNFLSPCSFYAIFMSSRNPKRPCTAVPDQRLLVVRVLQRHCACWSCFLDYF